MRGSWKRAGAAAAVLGLVVAAAVVSADPNPQSTNKDFAAFGAGDTTISVTSSTLDTVFFGMPASYVAVHSLTASMSIATKAVGSAATIRNVGGGTANPRTGLPVVDYELVTITAATSEYVSRTYDASCNAVYYGVVIDGQATGTVLVEWSRCAQ